MAAVYRIDSSQIVHEVFDSEIVIVHLGTGSYYSMRGVGAQIWLMVIEGASRDEIQQSVAARYAGVPEVIAREVDGFLEALSCESLIHGAEAEAASRARPPAGPVLPRAPFTSPSLERYSDMEKLLLMDPIHQVDEAGWPHPKIPANDP